MQCHTNYFFRNIYLKIKSHLKPFTTSLLLKGQRRNSWVRYLWFSALSTSFELILPHASPPFRVCQHQISQIFNSPHNVTFQYPKSHSFLSLSNVFLPVILLCQKRVNLRKPLTFTFFGRSRFLEAEWTAPFPDTVTTVLCASSHFITVSHL